VIPGLPYCVGTTDAPYPLWLFWVPLLVSETMLFVLAIRHGFWERWRDGPARGRRWQLHVNPPRRSSRGERLHWIVDVLIRDQLIYFVMWVLPSFQLGVGKG
jgi:hypothetical protein